MIKTIITSAAIATIGLIGMEAGWAAPSSAMTEAQRTAICNSTNGPGFALLGMVNCSNSEVNASRSRFQELNMRCQMAGYTQWSEAHGKCVSY